MAENRSYYCGACKHCVPPERNPNTTLIQHYSNKTLEKVYNPHNHPTDCLMCQHPIATSIAKAHGKKYLLCSTTRRDEMLCQGDFKLDKYKGKKPDWFEQK